MIRWLLLGVGVLAARASLADPAFIPLPVPPAPARAAPSGELKRDVERAVRGVRQRLEERELEIRGSRAGLEAYRARELRELERTGLGAPQNARADVDRARERIDLERRVDRIERQALRGAQ